MTFVENVRYLSSIHHFFMNPHLHCVVKCGGLQHIEADNFSNGRTPAKEHMF